MQRPLSARTSIVQTSAIARLGLSFVAIAFIPGLAAEWKIARSTRTVTVITRLNDEAGRKAARALLDPRDDIAEIYGVPVGPPYEVVAPADTAIWITPEEAPSRRLVPLEAAVRLQKPAAVRIRGWTLSLACVVLGAVVVAFARVRLRRDRAQAKNSTSDPS